MPSRDCLMMVSYHHPTEAKLQQIMIHMTVHQLLQTPGPLSSCQKGSVGHIVLRRTPIYLRV